MNSALKQYSKFYKKKLAAEAILNDLRPSAIRELKKSKDKQAVVDDVEYHITKKPKNDYPEDVKKKIERLRERAKKQGRVKTKIQTTLDAEIPKSVKEKVLTQVTEYKKYFGKDSVPVIVLGE